MDITLNIAPLYLTIIIGLICLASLLHSLFSLK